MPTVITGLLLLPKDKKWVHSGVTYEKIAASKYMELKMKLTKSKSSHYLLVKLNAGDRRNLNSDEGRKVLF